MESRRDVLKDMDDESRRIALELLATQVRWDLIRFFRANPYTIHTGNGLARIVGRRLTTVEAEAEALVKEGVLRRLPQEEGLANIYAYEPDPGARRIIDLLDEASNGRPEFVDEIKTFIENDS